VKHNLDIAAWVDRLPARVSRPLGRVVRSDLAHKVAATFATNVGLILIGLVTGVLIARALGPSGRGLLAAMQALTVLAAEFAILGMNSSNTYHVAKKPELLGPVLGNSLALSFGFGTAVALALGILAKAFPRLVPVEGVYLYLALAAIPVTLCLMLLRYLLLGLHEIRRYNVSELAAQIVGVVVLTLILVTGNVSVVVIAVATLLVVTAQTGWTAYVLMHGRHLSLRPSLRMFRSHMSYGFRAYLANLFSYALVKIDLLMCASILGAEQTGQYAIAVAMASLIYMLASTTGTIVFPRLAAMANLTERWQKSRSIARWVALAMILFSLVAAVLAEPLVGLLYGAAYLPSVPAFLWLLPGISMLGVNTIFMKTFASEGMPPISVWLPFVAALFNIALNLVLLPRIGIVGASLASTLAYALMLGTSLVYIRVTGRWAPPARSDGEA